MGFEVLIFALAQTQRTWSGSNKHTNRIVADLQIQISNRDHQTVVQSWAQPLPFRTTALWLQLSPSPQKDGTKGREHRGRKEKRARERARERGSDSRNRTTLEQMKIQRKTVENQRFDFETKAAAVRVSMQM